MMRVCLPLILGAWLLTGVGLSGQQTGAATSAPAAEAAPKAPPAGAPGTYKTGAELMDWLKKNLSPTGEMTVSPVSVTDQYRVNIVHRVKPAGAIAHAGNTELHYIIEGAGTIVTGGRIVPAAQGSGASATIEGGTTKRVVKGDVVIVPENSAHWYKDVETEITYLEVRWLAPPR